MIKVGDKVKTRFICGEENIIRKVIGVWKAKYDGLEYMRMNTIFNYECDVDGGKKGTPILGMPVSWFKPVESKDES